MKERKRWPKIVLLHILLIPTLIYSLSFFSLAPKSWTGVDEAVVEKIAKEHGREAKPPIVSPDKGDILLFIFLIAGAVGGFAGGYFWRMLVSEKKDDPRGK
ncbi:MAG: cobalt ABC transporter permease [Geobacteraceae bacterium]|nr:cobalt ABC transporter permease [Geobacteraceae bacterium]